MQNVSSMEYKNTSFNTQGDISFSTTFSGELERPSYQITLSDGISRDVFHDEDGFKYYLIPMRLEFDAITQILQESKMQMHQIYLP